MGFVFEACLGRQDSTLSSCAPVHVSLGLGRRGWLNINYCAWDRAPSLSGFSFHELLSRSPRQWQLVTFKDWTRAFVPMRTRSITAGEPVSPMQGPWPSLSAQNIRSVSESCEYTALQSSWLIVHMVLRWRVSDGKPNSWENLCQFVNEEVGHFFSCKFAVKNNDFKFNQSWKRR